MPRGRKAGSEPNKETHLLDDYQRGYQRYPEVDYGSIQRRAFEAGMYCYSYKQVRQFAQDLRHSVRLQFGELPDRLCGYIDELHDISQDLEREYKAITNR